MVPDRSSLPRSSRLLIKNISQKCSQDDHKMTLGGLHGQIMVHSTRVGAPMVPRGQVIQHQQTCRAQQRVVPTISRSSGSSKVHFKVLRGGGVEHHKRRWGVIYEGDIGSAWEWCQIKLHTSCDVPAALNHLKTTVVDGARSIFAPTVVSSPDQKIPTKVDMYFFTSGV